MVPLLCIAAAVAGYGHYTDPGPLPEAKAFVIPHGNNATVTKALQADGILSPTWASGAFFRISAFLTHRDGQIHASEFQFPPVFLSRMSLKFFAMVSPSLIP